MECADKSKPAPALALPNELWVEILSNIATSNLLELSLVCKHFNRLIFTHMTGRFRCTIDEFQIVRNKLNLPSERTYKHLCWVAPCLDPSSDIFKILKRLAPNVESLTLGLWRIDWMVVLQLLKLCTRLNSLRIEAFHSETDFLLTDSSVTFHAVDYLSVEIQSSKGWEETILPCFPNVRKLQIDLHLPINSGFTASMVNKVIHLDAEVNVCAVDSFLELRLSALKLLVLTWKDSEHMLPEKVQNLENFFMGCKVLNVVGMWFEHPIDNRVIKAVFNGLPHVTKLLIHTRSIVPLMELHSMTNLRELEIGILPNEKDPIAMPQVETLKCAVRYNWTIYQILERFPNLYHLEVTAIIDHRVSYAVDIRSLIQVAHCLKVLKIEAVFLTRNMIDPLRELICLKNLAIQAIEIAKTSYCLLRKAMLLPELKSLQIEHQGGLGLRPAFDPTDNLRTLAAANRTCELTFNGERVPPAEIVRRRTQVKRKYPKQE